MTARQAVTSRTLPFVPEAAPRDQGVVGPTARVVVAVLLLSVAVCVLVSLSPSVGVVVRSVLVVLLDCPVVPLSVADNTTRTSRQCPASFQPSMLTTAGMFFCLLGVFSF